MHAYAVTLSDGRVGIITLGHQRIHQRVDFDDDESFESAQADAILKQVRRLDKTLLELNGGVNPLPYIEIDTEIDLPLDRSQRNNWEIFEGKVQVKPA